MTYAAPPCRRASRRLSWWSSLAVLFCSASSWAASDRQEVATPGQIFDALVPRLERSLGLSQTLRAQLLTSRASLTRALARSERLQQRLTMAKSSLADSLTISASQRASLTRLREALATSKAHSENLSTSLDAAQHSVRAAAARHRRDVIVAAVVGAGVGAAVLAVVLLLAAP